MQYCLGFAFDEFQNNVLLSKKARPEWQAGLYNGVGGKIEEEETPLGAMIREFEEETGELHEEWNFFGEMLGEDWTVVLYKTTILREKLAKICDNTVDAEEPCKLFPVNELEGTISNLSWLVPMALDDIGYSFRY